MDTDRLVTNAPPVAMLRPGGRARRPEDREREIVRAALDLFVARGFAATKLEDVARAAKVSKGLPYLYFRSKEELFKAVIREAILEPLHSGADLVATFQGTTEELLRKIVGRFQSFTETPAGGVFKLAIAEAGNFPDVARYFVDEIERRGLQLFIDVLKRGIARGEIRPLADVTSAAIMLRSPLGMYAIWRWSLAPHTEPKLRPDAFFDTYIDIHLRGLRP
ncbi:MAG: TetR/AcrR family transcriptional regulator [Alphaproteobacteria bacterium]|nr:TetR/AcrR family transcriptional regulator [Alphaproteobacteria bacterium]